MAPSSTDGMYLFYSIPLGLANLIQDVIGKNQGDPNTPQLPTAAANRAWFSQPRPAQATATKHTLFVVGGTANIFDLFDEPSLANAPVSATTDWGISPKLDASTWNVVTVSWPSTTMPLSQSISAGVSALTTAVNACSGKFALLGTSQGAIVTSLVYDALRFGNLINRRDDLIAGLAFSNPMREQGRSFPGCPDPGGHGIMSTRLEDTEDLWYEFANPLDPATTVRDVQADQDETRLFDLMAAQWVGVSTDVANVISNYAGSDDELYGRLILTWRQFQSYQQTEAPEEIRLLYSHAAPISSKPTVTSVDHAIQYLQTVGAATPMPMSNLTTEVLQINFKLPMSVSEVGWDALRVSSHTEIWYQDRLNNWRRVVDESRIPIALDLSSSQAVNWYKAHFYCYPFVAKALQFRIKRTPSAALGSQPYPVGMRNALIRRNIYTRSDGTQGIEPQQDPLGNTYTSYIKDWDAPKAFDNDPTTYWKSMPMPDPSAVVALYLDCRNSGGGPELIDTLAIDPVYTGQSLNIYYSNDDSQGTLKLSPVAAIATTDTNTKWQQGRGRWDTSSSPGTSAYRFPMAWGPLVSQDAWIGVEWTPDFGAGATDAEQTITITGGPTGGNFRLVWGGQTTATIPYNASAATVQAALQALSSIGVGNATVTGGPGPNTAWVVTFRGALGGTAQANINPTGLGGLTGGTSVAVTATTTQTGGQPQGPASNPVLFEVVPDAPDGGQYWPRIYYDVGGGLIVLELTNGTTSQLYSVALSPILQENQPLRIVAGWGYDPKTVFLSVKTSGGAEVGTLTQTTSSLPNLMTMDGMVGFANFRGLLTAHVIKLENWSVGQYSFQANPQVYVSPDPVLPDPSGNVPATTLDNAIYAAAWPMQEHGTGGDHESRYDAKVWTPIWQNYFTQKGKLYFPQQINLKYLKLEFTNLTEEPYPVYDSGIQTSYTVFPVSVTTGTGADPSQLGNASGLLSMGSDVVLGGVASVNFLNPSTVNNAVNSIFGQVLTPVLVTQGQGQLVNSLPNTNSLNVVAQTRQELNTPWVYRRSPLNAATLASQQLVSTTGDSNNQGMSSAMATVSDVLASTMTGQLGMASTPMGLPVQGADWWVFPGSTLRLPAPVMNGLTGTSQTVTARADTTTRLRFTSTSVHRYDVKTATRDAAVAYFAGVREVQPLKTTYIASQDPLRFKFSSYDPTQWVLTNTQALDSGPLTTAGDTYFVFNSNFDLGLDEWDQEKGAWGHDASRGHWNLGSATIIADGTEKVMSCLPVDVTPGAHLEAGVWTQWEGLSASNSSQALQLRAMFYHNGTFVSSSTVGISYNPWPSDTPIVSSNNWTQIQASVGTGNLITVPAGVDQMALAVVVTADATAGQVWFDTVTLGTTDTVEASVFKSFTTTSTFAKVKCTFTDSGLVRSDSMWARQDPANTNISATALAYYTSTIPDTIPAGMWGDTFADWSDKLISWGAPRAVVAINVDPDRIYDGKRVLHFTREGGASEAGIKVRQFTNFVANGLFRIGAVFLKPFANTNQVTVRLRRISDGVYVYEETFDPVVGYWYEHVTDFIEIPDSEDQQYTVELVCTGDQPDELYLNDLYCEVANIRYFVRVGDNTAFLHDVTQLRYANSAVVSTTVPVNEFSVQLAILSPKAYAYSATLEPVYLK